jgi:hypothetical protein
MKKKEVRGMSVDYGKYAFEITQGEIFLLQSAVAEAMDNEESKYGVTGRANNLRKIYGRLLTAFKDIENQERKLTALY